MRRLCSIEKAKQIKETKLAPPIQVTLPEIRIRKSLDLPIRLNKTLVTEDDDLSEGEVNTPTSQNKKEEEGNSPRRSPRLSKQTNNQTEPPRKVSSVIQEIEGDQPTDEPTNGDKLARENSNAGTDHRI